MDIRLIPAAALTWVAAWWLTRSIIIPHLVTALAILLVALVSILQMLTRVFNSQSAVVAHLTIVIAGVLVVAISASNYQKATGQLRNELPETGIVTVIGKVVTEPRKAPFGNNFVFTIQELTHRVEIEITGPIQPYRSAVQITGTLKESEPGRKEILRITAKEVKLITPPKVWWRATNSLRRDLMSVTSSLTPQGAGLVPGMAIGDTSRLPGELKTAF